MKISSRSTEVGRRIEAREPFRTYGALWGGAPAGAWLLQGEDLAQWKADRSMITYAVYSYSTPIGWATPTRWHRVSQKFSVTTSRHMGQIPWSCDL